MAMLRYVTKMIGRQITGYVYAINGSLRPDNEKASTRWRLFHCLAEEGKGATFTSPCKFVASRFASGQEWC